MFLKMEVRLAVLGAGESLSMSSSSLLISIGFSSSPATADEVTEDAEEEDVTEEPLLEARTAREGMVGPTAGAIGTEPMITSCCLPAEEEVEEKVPEFSTVVKEWLEGSVTQVALELDAAEGSSLKRRSSRASSMVGREILNWSLFPVGLNPSP